MKEKILLCILLIIIAVASCNRDLPDNQRVKTADDLKKAICGKLCAKAVQNRIADYLETGFLNSYIRIVIEKNTSVTGKKILSWEVKSITG